jgi:hypothetical protein
MPEVIFAVCILLLVANYGLRWKGLYARTYQAHPATWLVISISCFAQAFFILAGEGASGLFWQIFFTGFFDVSILIWGAINLKRDGLNGWKFTKVDLVLLVVSIICIGFYFATKDATVSAAILFSANVTALFLQWKKSVYAPKTELPLTSAIAMVRCLLMTYTAQKIDVVTSLNTWVWAIVELVSLLAVGIGVLRAKRTEELWNK